VSVAAPWWITSGLSESWLRRAPAFAGAAAPSVPFCTSWRLISGPGRDSSMFSVIRSLILPVISIQAFALLTASASAPDVTMKEHTLPILSHPHDVAPAADGGIWYTPQLIGGLGWLDPATGKTRRVGFGVGYRTGGLVWTAGFRNGKDRGLSRCARTGIMWNACFERGPGLLRFPRGRLPSFSTTRARRGSLPTPSRRTAPRSASSRAG
jgi:hypothetical protein